MDEQEQDRGISRTEEAKGLRKMYKITSDQGQTVKVIKGQRNAEAYIRTLRNKSYSVEEV